MPATTALPGPSTLLRDVLIDPFGLTDELLIGRWLNELVANFPLLSFQSSKFAEYCPESVPVTYPLQIFINSIFTDDGISTAHQQQVDPPLSGVDRRRSALASAEYDELGRVSFYGGSAPDLLPTFTAFVNMAEPTEIVGDDDGNVESRSAYEEIGRELVWHLNALEAASTGATRKTAEKELKAFLQAVTTASTGGRMRTGPHPDLAKALSRELRELLQVAIDALPFTASVPTCNLLKSQGVADAEVTLWVLRLAFPVLSKVELGVLLDSVNPTARPKFRGGKPTPRRLAVWILARRLGMDTKSFGRRVCGSTDEIYFSDPLNNPFK